MKSLVPILLLAVAIHAATLNATNSTTPIGVLDSVNNVINKWLGYGTYFLANLEYTLKYYITKISEVVAVIMAMVGAFLYFSRLSRYTGRSLLVGAVLLYLLAQILKGL